MMTPQNEPSQPEQLFADQRRQGEKVAATRDQLLAQVLGETLARRHEDPDALLRWLNDWQRTQSDTVFGPDLCQRLVRQVLLYRMGTAADGVPSSLVEDVAAVLWNDPLSRQRIERLWLSLERSS